MMASQTYTYHVFDEYFEELGHCTAEDPNAILEEYPQAYYMLCSDYATRERSFRAIPAVHGPYYVKPDRIQSLKKNGGYIGIEGRICTFASIGADGSINKCRKKHLADHYDFVTLINNCKTLRDSGIQCDAMLSENTLYRNPLAGMLDIVDDDSYYGGDIVIRFHPENKEGHHE